MLHVGNAPLFESTLGFLLFIRAMFPVCLFSQFDTMLRFSYKFLYSPAGFLSWLSSGLSLIELFKELQTERESEYSKRETQTFNLIIFRQEVKLSWSDYPSCLPCVCMCHHLTNIDKSNYSPCISPVTLYGLRLYSFLRTRYLTVTLSYTHHFALFLNQDM